MDLVKASKLILNTAYTCANIPLAARSFVLYKRYYGAVKKNRSIRNKYDGDRCFVLGNGPSLNMVDLNKLVGKKIITVNMLYRHSFYEKLNPIFHCAIDQVMYRDEVGRTFLEVIKNHGNINFLVSTNAPNELKALPNTYQTILGYLPSSVCNPYDLSRPSAAFMNIILFAIELAIYLGFKEIVLLGCDFNQFATRQESHSYEEIGSGERKNSMFLDLQAHAISIMQHEWLFSYAKKNDVSIVNATEGSYLDVYPRGKFDNLIQD